MLTIQIAIVPGTMSSADLTVVRSEIDQLAAALQIQLVQHFGPQWEMTGSVSSFTSLDAVPAGYWPIIIQDQIPATQDWGYHTDNGHNPYAVIKYDPNPDNWTTTTSHEMCEMLADPWGNRVISAPAIKPDQPNDSVQYLVEVCDPVQANAYTYAINNVAVSDFVFPAFYGPDDTAGPFDYRNAINKPRWPSPGGSVAWEDLTDGNTYELDIGGDGTPAYKKTGSGTFKNKPQSLREQVNAHFGPRNRGDFTKAFLAFRKERIEAAKASAMRRATALQALLTPKTDDSKT